MEDEEEEEGGNQVRQRGREVLIRVTGHLLWSLWKPWGSEQTRGGNSNRYAVDEKDKGITLVVSGQLTSSPLAFGYTLHHLQYKHKTTNISHVQQKRKRTHHFVSVCFTAIKILSLPVGLWSKATPSQSQLQQQHEDSSQKRVECGSKRGTY